MNIFIEGVPGCGKSTLADKLAERFPQYTKYSEGVYSPVELAWCAYMDKNQYDRAIELMPEMTEEIKKHTIEENGKYIVTYTKIRTDNWNFYQYMEQYEIYSGRRDIKDFTAIIRKRFEAYKDNNGIFECSFFQNSIEELMLFAKYSDDEIIEFYKELITHIDMKNFIMIRLVSDNLRDSIKKIKEERVNDKGEEDWYRLMMDYLMNSPYGKDHEIRDFEDMLKHFERRMAIEDKVINTLLKDKCINIISKQYSIDEVIAKIN